MSTHDPDQREDEPPDQPEQPDDMREADIANGENPDAADGQGAGSHRTGQEAARRNRENESPA